MLHFLFFVGLAAYVQCQDYSKIPKWADFGFYGSLGFKELDHKLSFIMDNYEIISIEKCTGQGNGKTEDYFVDLTARARELKPDSKSRILNYFATNGQGFQCYHAYDELKARPDLMLKDANGDTVLHGNANVEFYDFRIEEARDLYVKAVLDPVKATDGGANGAFIDGTGHQTLINCHYKTCGQDQAQCCVFSEADEQEYNEGLKLALLSLLEENKKIDPDNFMIGNGLMNYDFNAGNGNPVYDDFRDFVDGFCMEHTMGFEGTNHGATEAPFIKIDALENLIELRNRLVADGQYVLVRSFPGPVGSPILSVGGLSTPQLPDHYPYPNPTNNIEVQQAMKDLFRFPLGVFLCAFAGPKVYYTYSVWYDVRQHVPSVSNPEESQFPGDWTQFLDMNPGEPLEEPQWQGRQCSRQFTNFKISVNLEDENSATWS